MLAWAPRGLAEARRPWPTGEATLWALLCACGAAALAFGRAGPGAADEGAVRALLTQTAVALALFDARHLLIPDLYVVAFALAGLAGPLSPGFGTALAGAAAGAALTGAVRLAVGRALGREALGWGDVKLAAALGALLGPTALLWTLAAASALGAVAVLALRRRRGPDAPLPFGAVLAPVAAAWLWWGPLL